MYDTSKLSSWKDISLAQGQKWKTQNSPYIVEILEVYPEYNIVELKSTLNNLNVEYAMDIIKQELFNNKAFCN